MLKRFLDKMKKRRNYVQYLREKGMNIGEGCEIYPSASFGSEPYLISIGDKVRVNSGVSFVTHDGGVWVVRNMYDEYREADMFGRINIGNNVHIGTNSIIMPGVNVGNNCIIGCGAVVTKNIPDNSIAVGVPARVIRNVSEYVERHKDEFLFTKNLSHDEKRKLIVEKLP